MKLRQVPARQGALWVRNGFRVFFRKPIAFAMLFATFLFAGLVFMLLPYVGGILLLMALPLATLGFMLGTQTALKGNSPTAAVFWQPLRVDKAHRLALLKLGLVYAACTVAILWLADGVDGGKFDALQELMANSKTPAEEIQKRLLDPQLQSGLAVRLGLASLLSLPFWHAPALIHWGAQGWAKAMFFSTVACWRNKGAFAVYGFVWLAVVLLFAAVVNTVFIALGAQRLVTAAAMPAGLMFSTVFYASLFFSFVDCFEPTAGPAVPADSSITPLDAISPQISPEIAPEKKND
jgi:hypothetical protein